MRDVLQLAETSGEKNAGLQELAQAVRQFQNRNIAASLAGFEKARQANPELPPGQLMLARLQLATGQVSAGRLSLEQVAASDPDDPDVHLVLGDLAVFDGRLSDAQLQFRHAVELLDRQQPPADSEVVRRWKARAHGGLAAVAERRNDWQTAGDELAEQLQLDPKNGVARQRLGRMRFQQKRYKEAAEEIARAEQDDPRLEPAAITLGRLFQQAGLREKAAEWMAYAEKKSPKDARVQVAVAIWHLESDRAEQAQAALERAAKLDPAYPELVRLQGLIARYRQDYAAAEAHFQSLVQDNPADFAATNQLALVQIAQGDDAKHKRALQLAEINARQYPRSAEALATLGWVYFRLGRLNDAEAVLKNAIGGGRASAETAYYLARVLAERGHKEEARRLVEGALAAGDTFALRGEATAWLEQLPKKTQAAGPDATE